MIQKTIRPWGGVPYTNSEADELTQELNDRTVYGVDGYNSVAEIGAKTADIETKTDFITVTANVDLDAEKSATSLNTAKRSYPAADETKLAGIENNATADQTGSEIKSLYESEANAYTDAKDTRLANTSGTNTGDQDLSSYDTHIAQTDNPHSVTKTQVGLSNVDNTSDIDKPISTATQSALDGKPELSDSNNFTGAVNTFRETHISNSSDGNSLVLRSKIASNPSDDIFEIVRADGTNYLEIFKDGGGIVDMGSTVIDNLRITDDPATDGYAGNKGYNDARYTQSNLTGEPTGSDRVVNMVSLTQSEYDAGTPNATTFYIITDA